MSPPIFTRQYYTAAFLSLLPTGPIWPRALNGIISRLASVWVQPIKRNGDRAANLLADAFPATTQELLPEWQKTLGLPDPVQPPGQTLEQAQGQVVARLVGSQATSIPELEAVASTLGYSATITPQTAFYFGMTFGSQFGGEGWNFVLVASVDDAPANDHSVLEYELRRLCQSGTLIYFNYTG
ncbi:putative phage tail protein [Acetobacter cibinongensis]|uniref:putative phage tail protein n=1 Tax=Acetobacter cibinongensis TaxID=146475 RepID=UPI000A37374A|nr:putative phage tail protein [Acetobacter cibinongensis]